MLELGKRQSLTVVKTVDFGVYLSEGEGAGEEVLLPKKEVPEGTKTGDVLEVFLYKDSKDRLIATREEAAIQLGEVALLKVAETGKIGAFLDWGLPKDLLLPFREQTRKVEPGDECLVALYIDKSSRLCATMKVYHYLRTDSPYHKDDRVEGFVYEISKNFGVFVAVDNCYSALIPRTEPAGDVKEGDRITARVTEVKEDGKLSLSIREKAYIQIGEDAKKLLALLEEEGGSLPVGDKSSPELIREKTGMSKNEFKRAAGNLYKQRIIKIEENCIQKLHEEKAGK